MIEYLLRLWSFIPNDYVWFAIFLFVETWGFFMFLAWGKQRLYEKELEEFERIRENAKVEAIKRRALEREQLMQEILKRKGG